MIVAAAIKYGEMVLHLPAPMRHADILRSINRHFGGRTDISFENECQGFLTDDSKFLSRTEAYRHVHECGQGTPRRTAILATGYNAYNGQELFSEDLW
jgi:hypothetical protein